MIVLLRVLGKRLAQAEHAGTGHSLAWAAGFLQLRDWKHYRKRNHQKFSTGVGVCRKSECRIDPDDRAAWAGPKNRVLVGNQRWPSCAQRCLCEYLDYFCVGNA